MTDELKPCPFCGGKAELLCISINDDIVVYIPRCQEPDCCGRLRKKWSDLETAIYAWNRRSRQ